ncbi:MAG: U-box-domain-containing protein [Aureobasidium pullulans]|nr:MAG: U-box-domain-containing protein [Aureobasidium pullulans]
MSSNGIKTEDGAFIKPEHVADEYEDTGECHMPANPEEQRAWLCRLPKWLWTAWEDMADDEEIELGKIRVYHQGNKDGTSRVRMKLHDHPKHHDVPKLYDLTTTRAGYSNTVVFSERDQPGFKAWNPNRVRKDGQRNNQYKVNKNKPYTSSIPKQTALAGYVTNEMAVTAVENDEYRRLTDKRFMEMFHPKRTTRFESGPEANVHSNTQANQAFSSFIKATQAKKPVKKQQEKAVRVSQEELFDLLTDCFKQYRYWSLKALKQRLHQPEAFIKSTVEKIATLMRSGRFAMNYKLNPEYERTLNIDSNNVKEEVAAEEDDDDDDDEDEDGYEDVKMEDS